MKFTVSRASGGDSELQIINGEIICTQSQKAENDSMLSEWFVVRMCDGAQTVFNTFVNLTLEYAMLSWVNSSISVNKFPNFTWSYK